MMLTTEREEVNMTADRVLNPGTIQLTRVGEGSGRGTMTIVGLAERNVGDGFWVNSGGAYTVLATAEAISLYTGRGLYKVSVQGIREWEYRQRFMEGVPYPSAEIVDGLVQTVEKSVIGVESLAFGPLVRRVGDKKIAIDESQLAVWRMIRPSGGGLERKLVNDYLTRFKRGNDSLVMDVLRRRADQRRLVGVLEE